MEGGIVLLSINMQWQITCGLNCHQVTVLIDLKLPSVNCKCHNQNCFSVGSWCLTERYFSNSCSSPSPGDIQVHMVSKKIQLSQLDWYGWFEKSQVVPSPTYAWWTFGDKGWYILLSILPSVTYTNWSPGDRHGWAEKSKCTCIVTWSDSCRDRWNCFIM